MMLIMKLLCPLFITGAINSNLASLSRLNVDIKRFTNNIVERNFALGAMEFHDVYDTMEDVNLRYHYFPQLSPLIVAQLLLESRHLTRSEVKTIINDSGRRVSVGGYAQMDKRLRAKYLKLGMDVFTIDGSLNAMSHYMMKLCKDVWDQLTEEDRKRITVKQLWVNALKRYNGTGYSTYRTIRRTLDNLGSSGSLENRDYVVTVLGGFVALTPSELRGINSSGTIRDFGKVEDTKEDALVRLGRIAGIQIALKSAGFCIEETAMFLDRKVIESGLFRG